MKSSYVTSVSYVTYNDLVSWMVRNQKFDLTNYAFRKFLDFFRLFFDKSDSKIRH